MFPCVRALTFVGALCLTAIPLCGAEPTPRTGTDHWAFQPLARSQVVPPPATAHGTRPVDRFIEFELSRANLSLSPEANRATLIRRVAFLLTGLPPTLDEIDGFESDRSPSAYERMVDRYLASPRYGERWGKHWLDAAGYADSNGYFNADSDRPLAFRYRDYVLRSLNRDKPFDQFLREQLAGDELSGWSPGQSATPEIVEMLEATHFLRNGQDGSGESDGNPDEVRTDRYYALESAMQIVGSSLLGLTVQCAKCHDHKFEPISQQDYYAFQAFFYPAFHIEKWTKPNDRIAKAPLPGELESWKATEQRLDRELAAVRVEFQQWSAAHRPPGQVLFSDSFDTTTLAGNWSNTAPGDVLPGGTPPVAVDSEQAPGAYGREGALRLVEGGGGGDRWLCTTRTFDWRPAVDGAWIQATFDLIDDRLTSDGKRSERIGYFIAAHDFDDRSDLAGGNLLIDGNPTGPSVVEVDYPGKDSSRPGRIGTIGYRPGHHFGVRVTRIGTNEFHLEHLVDGTVDGPPLKLAAADLPPGAFAFEYCCGRSFIVDNVRVEISDDRNPAWAKLSADYGKALETRRKELALATEAIGSQRRHEPGRIAWMTDSGPEAPPVPMLKRGNHKTPGDPVAPAFPAFLASNHKQPAVGQTGRTTGRRRAWSEWLLQPGSPQVALLARVTVNRVWQQYFGTGIVATPDNLGLSGAKPSHPELLDWLSMEFIDSGWSLKALHRRILLSRTFRQTNAASPEGLAHDPDNRRLWHFPLRRLDAEAIRDAMLFTSGRLGSKSAGPYVPTPRDGTGEVNPDEAHPDADARTVFLQNRRTQIPTMLGTFDAPSIVFNCTRRAGTTMPLQSLTLLNSRFTVARGEDLAGRLLRECSTESARIERAFRLVCGRPPTPVERASTTDFLRRQTHEYAAMADPERRAWNDLCQSLYALNAFLHVE